MARNGYTLFGYSLFGPNLNSAITVQNPRRPSQAVDDSGHHFLTQNPPEPMRVMRMFDAKLGGFKGLKNHGGLNNADYIYLPRVIRYNRTRSASPAGVQLRGTMAITQSNIAIRPIFVPAAELR